MKLPNWFKITWWLILLIITSTILIKRYNALITGQSVAADIFVILIFVSLMLVPIFSEIEFFGIKFKRELEDLKKDINIKLGDIKNDIRNSQNQTFNATIHGYGPPPSDNELPELEEKIDRIIKEKLNVRIMPEITLPDKILDVPESNSQMFKVRYNIEFQLRRIWNQKFQDGIFNLGYRGTYPVIKILKDLSEQEIIDNNFQGILKEILAICNYAIHGREVTEKQINFVIKNAVQVLDYLRRIE